MVLQSLQGLPAFVLYFCVASVAVMLYLFAYMRVTAHDEWALVRNNVPGAAIALGGSLGKPLYSREGANVQIVVGGNMIDFDTGPYGAEGYIRQAVATLPQYDGNYAVLGSWVVQGKPCGLSVREDINPITKNTSRFLPHAIVG